MWVKAESGRLFNLSHAQSVDVYEIKEGECCVITRFAGTGLKDSYGEATTSNPLVAELSSPKPRKETEKCLERIGHSLERKEAFIDLTRADR